jgi:Fe-S cluster biogenesis protein NfuA
MNALQEPTASVPQAPGEVLEAQVCNVLELQIRPLLLIHGGGIDLVGITADGRVELEFQGACRGCALQAVTYAIGVRQRLLEIPGVTEVEVRGVRLSKAALKRTSEMYRGFSFAPGGNAHIAMGYAPSNAIDVCTQS